MGNIFKLSRIVNVADFIRYIDNEAFNTPIDQYDDLVYIEPIIVQHNAFFETYYFIYCNETIVGYCSTSIENEKILEKLYITPAFRRIGIASFVLKTLGIKLLLVVRKNEPAIKLYLKNGFQFSNRMRFKHAVYMEKL